MPTPRPFAHLTAAAILASAPIALAQTPEPAAPRASTTRPTPPPSDLAPTNPGPTVSVEFPGGTAKEFVDAVRQAAGIGKVNVVMPKEAESVPLPAVSLREVSAYTALQALEYAASPESGNQFSISRLGRGDEASATFAIRYANRNPTPYPGMPLVIAPHMETHVFSIRELVEPPQGLENDPAAVTSTETILNALKSASQLEADARGTPPDIMLHKDSLLLLVRGTQDQHRTVEQVLGQLTQALTSKRQRAAEAVNRVRTAALEQAEFKAQSDILEVQLHSARTDFQRATESLERIKKSLEAGQSSAVEVSNAEAALDTARRNMDETSARQRLLNERAAILQARKDAGGATSSSGPVEAPVAVIYDFSDMEAFNADVYGVCFTVCALQRPRAEVQVERRGKDTVRVIATPAEHKAIVVALNAMRRAKANEPKLPGLDADTLIRKGEGR